MDLHSYPSYSKSDPLRFYYYPVIGNLYRKRIEACLDQLEGGEKVLEVGYGSGLCLHNLCGMYREVHGVDLDAPAEAVAKFAADHGLTVQLSNGNVTALDYPSDYFDAVLLISILEHLRPVELETAMSEIKRVLRPGGQMVYGVPVDRKFMTLAFGFLGYDIRKLHFSTHLDVSTAAARYFIQDKLSGFESFMLPGIHLYQIGCFRKPTI